MDLGLETEKSNVGIRIRIVKIVCVPIFSQYGQLWLFLPKFAKNKNLGFEIQKTNVEIRVSILKIPCVPIFRQNRQL